MAMKCSAHANTRMKERLSLNTSASQRLAAIAYENGISQKDASGKLQKYFCYLALHTGKSLTMRIYGRHVYLFGGDKILVTVLQLPKQYHEIVDKIMKRKEVLQ